MFYFVCLFFFRFQLVPRTQEGKVFAPLMSVTYRDVLIRDADTQTVSVSQIRQTHTFIFLQLPLSVSAMTVFFNLLASLWRIKMAIKLKNRLFDLMPNLFVRCQMKFAVEYEMDQSEARIKTDVSRRKRARVISAWSVSADADPSRLRLLSPRRLWVCWGV